MTCPACTTARWLVRDTFRQARAAGICWVMFGVSALCVLLCLTATVVPGEAPGQGRLELAFGALEFPFTGGPAAAVRTLQLQLGAWVADAAGLLLVLIWTASFLPTFLEPGAVAVLLAKPVARWQVLGGKFLGVLAFVAVQATLFVGGTWLALALRTGVWGPAYLLCVPLLLLHFAIYYSLSALLAVVTRSTPACVFGSVLFWVLSWAMNFGRHASRVVAELHTVPSSFGHTVELGYWILPKPFDFHLLLMRTLQADNPLAGLVDARFLALPAGWSALPSVLTSALCALVLLAMTAYEFVSTDY